MSRPAIVVDRIAKRYRIPHPKAPRMADYLKRPRWSRRQSRTLEVMALSDVSFDVHEGEVFGIIGRNGAGKSTLLKILSRITTPTRGHAEVAGRVASLLEVGTGFHPDLTGRENVYLNGMLLGMSARAVDRAFDDICEFADIGAYIDSPIKRYSSGMQLRLAFAVAAHLAADTMIVDEVLAVGDAEFQAKCTTAMRDSSGRGRTTLFVSHNMAAVQNLCTRVMLLQSGRVARIGTADDVIGEYLRQVGQAASGGLEWLADAERHCGSSLRFTRVSVSGEEGRAPAQGETLCVEIGFEARKTIRKLQLLVSLNTPEGLQVCGSSNGDYREEWDVSQGAWRVTTRFPAIRLMPRDYTVSVKAFVQWGAEVFDEVPNAVTFHVAGRDALGTGILPLANRGVTWLPAHFECVRTDGGNSFALGHG
jgi:lipopolysaccharide transport system ATP-binding protein